MSAKKKLRPDLKINNLCLNTLYATMKHYFPKFKKYLQQINDFRQTKKVKYSTETMVWMGLIERLAGFKSNNEFEIALRTSTEIEKNMSFFLDQSIDELPSVDDFCYFFQHIIPLELHKIRKKMLKDLERKKFLENLKTKDGYLLLAIDGVQTFSTKRKIEHSINREHKNTPKTYHQYFLEAKIVSKNGFVMSIDTEPIENPTEKFIKQDCERKAALRLLKRIKKEHPHLKFCILGDGLYCNSVIIDICNKHHWKYSFTFKGETQYPKLLKAINAQYNSFQQHNHITRILKKNKNTTLYIKLRWCNNVNYELGENSEHGFNYLEGKVFKIKNGIESEVATFAFLINSPISKINALRKLNECRTRWKIENEGFNFQKNNILYINHNFSSVGHAGQNFYLLAQIVHTIIQLTGFSDIAGQVRRQLTHAIDKLSQSLKSIFSTFRIIVDRIKVEFLDKVFKPPLIKPMRVRLKLA